MYNRRPFVRYDPGCMEPVSTDGPLALALLSRDMWPDHGEEFHWNQGKALIIDNWRVLHGRGETECDDRDRTLLRVYIR